MAVRSTNERCENMSEALKDKDNEINQLSYELTNS